MLGPFMTWMEKEAWEGGIVFVCALFEGSLAGARSRDGRRGKTTKQNLGQNLSNRWVVQNFKAKRDTQSHREGWC